MGIEVVAIGVGVEEVTGVEDEWGWGGRGSKFMAIYLLESLCMTQAAPGTIDSLHI
jgi:hypothetical protein